MRWLLLHLTKSIVGLRDLRAALAALLVAVVSTPSHAYAPLNTDDAGTVGKGTNQVEIYFSQISEHTPGAGAEVADSTGEEYQGVGTARAFPFVYMRGLTDNLDASFSSTYYLTPTGSFSPFANYIFGLKWRFAGDGESGWNFTVKPQVILPAGSEQQVYGIGNALVNYGMTGIASRYWDQAELHLNASYLRAPYNPNYLMGFTANPKRTNLYFFSAAPVWVVSPKFRLALDVGFNTNPEEPEQSLTTFLMLAMIYSATKNLDLGISYQRNAQNFGTIFAADAPYTSRFEVGLTYRFE